MPQPEEKFDEQLRARPEHGRRVASGISSLPTRNSQLATRNSSAFTLVELVIVLGIIIIVLAIAVPVWNALMGNNSLAAAQNQITGILSAARSDAVYYHQTIGVFFFIDPKSNQTAMAEVQVQPLWQPPYPGGGTAQLTSLFQPNVNGSNGPNNGATNSIELVNYYDPTNAQQVFYRDVLLLPSGVGVALNNDIFLYNPYGITGSPTPQPGTYPYLDRYRRVGAIMFAPDGTLTSIPIAVPNTDTFTNGGTRVENALITRLGFPSLGNDFGSDVVPPGGTTPPYFPMLSSIGLVIFDHNIYLTQHASMSINVGGTPTLEGSGNPFNDFDMNDNFPGSPYSSSPTAVQATDKFIEEHWLDQNGTALMVSPFNGSLIRAK